MTPYKFKLFKKSKILFNLCNHCENCYRLYIIILNNKEQHYGSSKHWPSTSYSLLLILVPNKNVQSNATAKGMRGISREMGYKKIFYCGDIYEYFLEVPHNYGCASCKMLQFVLFKKNMTSIFNFAFIYITKVFFYVMVYLVLRLWSCSYSKTVV